MTTPRYIAGDMPDEKQFYRKNNQVCLTQKESAGNILGTGWVTIYDSFTFVSGDMLCDSGELSKAEQRMQILRASRYAQYAGFGRLHFVLIWRSPEDECEIVNRYELSSASAVIEVARDHRKEKKGEGKYYVFINTTNKVWVGAPPEDIVRKDYSRSFTDAVIYETQKVGTVGWDNVTPWSQNNINAKRVAPEELFDPANPTENNMQPRTVICESNLIPLIDYYSMSTAELHTKYGVVTVLAFPEAINTSGGKCVGKELSQWVEEYPEYSAYIAAIGRKYPDAPLANEGHACYVSGGTIVHGDASSVQSALKEKIIAIDDDDIYVVNTASKLKDNNIYCGVFVYKFNGKEKCLALGFNEDSFAFYYSRMKSDPRITDIEIYAMRGMPVGLRRKWGLMSDSGLARNGVYPQIMPKSPEDWAAVLSYLSTVDCESLPVFKHTDVGGVSIKYYFCHSCVLTALHFMSFAYLLDKKEKPAYDSDCPIPGVKWNGSRFVTDMEQYTDTYSIAEKGEQLWYGMDVTHRTALLAFISMAVNNIREYTAGLTPLTEYCSAVLAENESVPSSLMAMLPEYTATKIAKDFKNALDTFVLGHII